MEVPMPELVRLYIRSVAFGFGIAVVFTAGVVWLDVAGVGHLILGSDIGWVAALMMVFFNGIIFGAVQFAYQIMSMAEDDAPTGGTGLRESALIPIPVEATVQRRKTRQG
jgi:TRAP-type C4-dicarboxylate transport system permease small subunit